MKENIKKRVKSLFFDNRGDIEQDKMIGWAIAILALVLILLGYFYLKNYLDVNVIENLKNIFRFGG